VALTPQIPRALSAEVLSSGTAGVKYVYRPAAVLRLSILLEDFTNDDGAGAQSESSPPKSPAAKAQAAAQAAANLQAVRRASGERDLGADAAAAVASRRAAASAAGTAAPGAAAAPLGKSRTDNSVQICVVPVDLTLNLDGFRTAAKLTFGVQLSDLPIAPEIVRAMFVEVFFGTAAVDDYADPASWIPRVMGLPPVFRGYAESEDMEADEEDVKISVSADSLEGRLNALKVNPFAKELRVAPGGEGLADYIRRVISTVPEFNGQLGDAIGVRYFPNVDPAKEPRIDAQRFKRSLQTAASRAQAGGLVQGGPPPGMDPAADPGGGQPAGVQPPSINPSTDVSIWDIVTRAALLGGMIPVYDPSIVAQEADGSVTPIGANNILLVPPQNIKETPQDGIVVPGGPVDGFGRDITVGGSVIHTDVRFFVWGSNIKKMKMSRKYGRNRAPRIRVICHNPDGPPGKRTLEAFFPRTHRATKPSAVGSGGAGSALGHQPIEEEIVREVREIRSQEALDLIAVALYHSISRHELQCTIETNELCSYLDPTRPETHNENPDILRLRPGTPCRVTVGSTVSDPSADLVVNGLSELFGRRSNPAFLRRALLENPNSKAFIAVGQKSALESALAKIEAAYASAKLTDWFYCRRVEYQWSVREGFSVTIELSGFLEARNLPANLAPQDAATNDRLKAAVSGAKPDGRAAAIQANTDQLLVRLAEAAVGGGG